MATITEDYVSFETAKLLKEKGFDEPCLLAVNEFSKDVTVIMQSMNNSMLEHEYMYLISMPTLQMSSKWLKVIHGIFISLVFIGEKDYFGFLIENLETKSIIYSSCDSEYETPENALEAAIKYCLEHLI